MSKVVLMMTDGLCPDALNKGYTPHLDKVYRRGAYTYQAQSVMPSVTLPCHMSIFHSVPPTRHGVSTNTWSPMVRPLPGMIEHFKDLHTAFFHSWEPLRNLNAPEFLNFSYFYHPDTTEYLDFDRRIVKVATDYINNDAPDFAFVYFHAIDMAGHDYGWMSDGYLQVTSQVDALLGELVASLPDDYAVMILSDHGGHDRMHGTDMPEDMTIPMVIAGENIKQGYTIQASLSLLDVAPIVARLLGHAPCKEWEGTCPQEIFINTD